MNGSVDPLAGLQSLGQGVLRIPSKSLHVCSLVRDNCLRVKWTCLWYEYFQLGGAFTPKDDTVMKDLVVGY